MVFTLGSAAVLAAGDFYEVSEKDAMELGTRAVLLIGTYPRNQLKEKLPPSICAAEYAPYSALFSRAALVVHQGGVGTVGQCLRAGKPMLIMPYSHDQPDNARRMKRLGVAQVIQKSSYTPKKVTRKLRKMLDDPELAEKASAVAEQLRGEDGVKSACDALEALQAREPVFAVNFDRPYDPYELSKPSLTFANRDRQDFRADGRWCGRK